MSNVIDLDDHRTTIDVAGVGLVVVRSARGQSGLRLTLNGAVRASAVFVAEAVVVLSTDLSRHQVRQLRTPVRRRFALAVARANGWEREWQALYGSYLSTDERLVASAVWGRRRQWRELRARLRSASARRITLQRQVSLGMPATVSASMRAALGINDTLRKVSGPLAAIRMAPASTGRSAAWLSALSRYRATIRDVVVLSTVTPVLVRIPRVNDSTRSRLAWNSAVPTRPRGALGPVWR